jgi:hypothetical protein
MEGFFGTLTMIFGTCMAVIAFPSQIIKNYKEKTCGPSFLMVIIPLNLLVSRACYTLIKEAWYIFIPDIIGIILSTVLLYQYFSYRKKGEV